jgi:hypothetical protein
MTNDEKTDLQDLVSSNGWLRFEHAMTTLWQGQLSDLVASAANSPDDATALAKLRQVIAAQRAVLQAVAWPKERLKMLTRPETVTSFSRGGYDPQTPR